ncbi:GSCOCG00004115001-RA-CDS, partial [Cotesia congregata]
NRKLKKFCSRFSSPESFRVDAFTISRENEKIYAFPPFALITPILKKLITDKSEDTFSGSRTLVKQKYLNKRLSSDIADIMLSSITETTLRQYESSLK